MAKRKVNGVTIWRIRDLLKCANEIAASKDGSHWFPARPLGAMWLSLRLRAMWLVWTCRADVVIWPEE